MLHAPEKSFGENPDPGLGTDIAVVGMAGRFPGASDIGAYWRNLREGVEAITRFSDEELQAAGVPARLIADPDYVKTGAPLPEMEMFDPGLFGLTPREAEIMDPQHRHFLECSVEALENAGHSVDRFSGPIGVFGGSGHNAYLPYNLLTNPALVRSVGFFLMRHTGNDKDFLTTRVSYLLNLKGPSMAVQTACSTSLVAIHVAVQSLLNRECDMALAGGATIELPHRRGYLHEDGGILSPDGHCRPFDRSSQGTVFGSGVGVVALRRLSDAIESGDHIYAVIKGSAVNNDGCAKVGYLAPSVDGQAEAVIEALTVAGVSADTIGYVEAHGSGTPVGDPIEVTALTQAFRRDTDQTGFCGIGSVKGNIGHTDTAAGVAGFIKVALALHHGELPRSLNYQAPNAACNFERSPFYVTDTLTPWRALPGVPRRAGVSSLGVGGTNAHVVLEQAPRRRTSAPAVGPQLLVISAASDTALDANTQALADHLAADPSLNLADVAFTLQVGRRALPHRRYAVVEDGADAVAVLRGEYPQRLTTMHAGSGDRNVAFMFAGGGAQHPNMGKDLYLSEPVFRDAVDQCLQLVKEHCSLDLGPILYPANGIEDAAEAMERPSVGLPALFTVQYAQAKLWMSWGVMPRGMIGHSLGEYVAAHLAGVFSLADALRLVHCRGQLFETLPQGAMLSVPMAADELAALIAPTLSIAASNGPQSTVVSGPVDAIEALRQELELLDTPASLLRISVAAHSSMLGPILVPFREFLAEIPMRPPTLPFVSCLAGTWITKAQAQSPDYWVRHLRETVRFGDGLRALLKDETCLLLEVGPGRTLASLARLHPDRSPQQLALNSSRHPTEPISDRAQMLDAVGKLWAAGVPMMFGLLHAIGTRLRLPLPTYRFDHRRYWIEPGSAAEAPEPDGAELQKQTDLARWLYRPTWRRTGAQAVMPQTARTLIFADDCGLAALVEAKLREGGADVVTVRPGRRFVRAGADSFRIDPGVPAHYERLLAALATESRIPAHVLHLWSVTGGGHDPASLREADELQRLGIYSLLHFAQAIAREDITSPIALMVVSDGMQRVSGETDLAPAKATLLGPCKVMPQELPNVRARSIDVVLPAPGSRRRGMLADALLAELSAEDGAEVVAIRAGERWVQQIDAIESSSTAPPLAATRPGGTYVITGGLGELGLALARHLANTPGVRLVLLGRGGLPPREEWIQILAGKTSDERLVRRLRQVLAIEKAGAEVLATTVDVTHPAELRRAIKAARARFGKIDGVFHTAGILDDGLIQMKDAASVAATLAPKVRGTIALQAALADEPPEFMMLFSSVSALTGVAGQVDYTAANAFLDAFAQQAAAFGDCNVVSVDWSQWQEIGMAAALARAASGARGQAAADEGSWIPHPLIDRCIQDGEAERLYATSFSAARHWLVDEHRVAGGQALIPGTGFLEIARAAVAERSKEGILELSDILFLEPFLVDDGEERELRIRVACDRDNVSKFELGSGSDDASNVVHVRGVARSVSVAEPDRLAIAGIRSRCDVRSTDRASVRPSPHMRFGPHWQNVVRTDYGEGEALIELALSEPLVGELGALSIHPALFDMATAGAQALIPGFDEATDFFIPGSYDRIRLYRPMSGKIFSHVRLRRGLGGADVAAFDVTIADQTGLVLAEVREFSMIRLRDRSLLARSGQGGEAPMQRSRSAAGDLRDQGHRNGILPSEGMATIDRILGLDLGPQVIVSPIDFNALLAKARKPLAPTRAGPAVMGEAGDTSQAMSPAEQIVATLWSELLGVSGIGPADNFFDLGGHSLLAVQFVNKLRRRTGTTLPATALIETPTVAQIAALFAPDTGGGETGDTGGSTTGAVTTEPLLAANTGGEAVRINGEGCGTPLFLVHDGLGEILLYRTLALRLMAFQPVYGLSPTRRPDGSVAHTRIEEMAAAHIAKVRRVQPHGPYLLGGLCAGGVIAFEMAAQLRQAGEDVSFVGILDAADVAARERPFYAARARLRRFLSLLHGNADGKDVGESLMAMMAKARNWLAYEVDLRLERARAARTVGRMRRLDPDQEGACAAGPGPAPMSYLDIYRIAHREHRPRTLFAGGDVVLFRATKGTGADDDTPFSEQFSDCALGWGRRVVDEVRIVPVPGGHVSMLQEPNVAVLARELQDSIERALAHAVDREREEARPTPPHRVASPAFQLAEYAES